MTERRWRFPAWPEAGTADLVDLLDATASERERALPATRAAWVVQHLALTRGGLGPLPEELRALVEAALGVGRHGGGSREEMLRLLEEGLRAGRLLVIPAPFEVPKVLPSDDREKLVEPPWDPFAEDKPLDWIEIQVVDESGAGVSGEAYVLVGPDGTREGRTDAEGLARFQRVEKGAYRVRFPNLDEEAIQPG